MSLQVFNINTISSKADHPDIFSKMNSKPKLKEIYEVFLQIHTAEERSVTCGRVLHASLKLPLGIVNGEGIFGNAVAWIKES